MRTTTLYAASLAERMSHVPHSMLSLLVIRVSRIQLPASLAYLLKRIIHCEHHTRISFREGCITKSSHVLEAQNSAASICHYCACMKKSSRARLFPSSVELW